jgi:hypothetical protein
MLCWRLAAIDSLPDATDEIVVVKRLTKSKTVPSFRARARVACF